MTRVDQIWKMLNEKGIYTEEQLYAAAEKVKIDIGIFTIKPNQQSNTKQAS